MFRRNIENFPVYLFTGQLLFNFMNQSTHQALTAINGNAALLKKAYIPKYIFVFSKITSGLVDFFFSCVALVIVMLVTRAEFSFWNLLFPVVALRKPGSSESKCRGPSGVQDKPILRPLKAGRAEKQHCQSRYYELPGFPGSLPFLRSARHGGRSRNCCPADRL